MSSDTTGSISARGESVDRNQAHVEAPPMLVVWLAARRKVRGGWLGSGVVALGKPNTTGLSSLIDARVSSEDLLQAIQAVRRQRVLDRIDDLVAVLLIEERGLEAVRVEREPGTTTRLRLCLRGGEKTRAVSAAAEILAHPERLDLADAAPGPAMEPGGDRAIRVAHEEGQPLPVVEAGFLHVVEVELIREEPDVFGSRL